MLIKKAGGDPYKAGLAIYRAKDKNDMVRWIMAGIKQGYVWKPCADEDNRPKVVKAWLEKYIFKQKRDAVQSVGDILASVVRVGS